MNKRNKGFTMLNPAKQEFRQRRNYLTGFTLLNNSAFSRIFAKRNLTGFTLVEVLVAISVIALLATIVLVGMGNFNESARIAKILQWSSSIHHLLGANCVGNWNFNEGTGDTVNDASGNGNNGNLKPSYPGDSPVWAQSDVSGNALYFDGSNDYVDCGSNASLSPSNEITVEAWFNLSRISGTNTILSKDNPGPTNYWTDIRTNATVIYVGGYTSASGACYHGTSVSTLSIDRWYHLAWTYNRERMITYLNGDIISNVVKTCALNTNDAPLRIGTRNGTGNMFNGTIDDVRIYNRALPEQTIREHYLAGLEKHQGLAKR